MSLLKGLINRLECEDTCFPLTLTSDVVIALSWILIKLERETKYLQKGKLDTSHVFMAGGLESSSPAKKYSAKVQAYETQRNQSGSSKAYTVYPSGKNDSTASSKSRSH